MPLKSSTATGSGQSPKGRNDQRIKAILGTVITAFVLAGVIFFLWAASSPQERKNQSTTTIQLSPSQKSDEAYKRGLRSMESSDTTGAIAAFKTAVQLDPNNDSAKSKLKDAETAQKAKQSATSGSSSSGTTKKSIDYGKKVSSLSSLLPTKVAAYELGPATSAGNDSARSGTPTDGGSVTRALWTVHYFDSDDKAAEFVQNVTKSVYARDEKTVTVNGVSAFFGTDGTRFATVAYRKKHYVFEVVLTTPSGNPAQIQPQTVAAGAAFRVQ
jgi:flagellar basal body-associated protein FliL